MSTVVKESYYSVPRRVFKDQLPIVVACWSTGRLSLRLKHDGTDYTVIVAGWTTLDNPERVGAQILDGFGATCSHGFSRADIVFGLLKPSNVKKTEGRKL